MKIYQSDLKKEDEKDSEHPIHSLARFLYIMLKYIESRAGDPQKFTEINYFPEWTLSEKTSKDLSKLYDFH